MSWTSKDIENHPRREALTGEKGPQAPSLETQFQLHAEQSEKELQDETAALLKRFGVWSNWSRTDKRTTNTLGCPDFVCCLPKGVFLAIECKVGGNKLTDEQNVARNAIEIMGGLYLVAYEAEPVRQILRAHCTEQVWHGIYNK